MSDRIYTNDTPDANHDYVTVAQACHGVLTKRFLADDTVKSYDNVKTFNLFEEEITCLYDLYLLCNKLLEKPRCAIIRARIKDLSNRKKVRRLCNDQEDGSLATLIVQDCHWFALDIDNFDVCTGDLAEDADTAVMELPTYFRNIEYFAVASSSYGVKPGINLRLFFWNKYPISNTNLKKVLRGSIADDSMFNPGQLIYTARPIFEDGIGDELGNGKGISWSSGSKELKLPILYDTDEKGRYAEKWYSKQEAEKILARTLLKIEDLTVGNRHEGLRNYCYLIGKLVGQGHFEREEMIERVLESCNEWTGNRNEKRDRETATYGIDRGIASMSREGK